LKLRISIPTLAFLGMTTLGGATSCHLDGGVVRVENGREVRGHWISPQAYSDFTEGTLDESRGELELARVAYERASGEDPASAGAWARLGAVLCATDPKAADAAFTHAESLNPESSGAVLSRAECELARGNGKGAVAGAERAVALAPNDMEASLFLGRAYEQSGDLAGARRWLRALALRHPGSLAAADAFRDVAERTGDRPDAELASARVSALVRVLGGSPGSSTKEMGGKAPVAPGESPPSRPSRTPVSAVDRAVDALSKGDVEQAASGAARMLSAEPGNTDARILALVCADLTRNDDAFGSLVVRLPEQRIEPTLGVARLFSELIERRVGTKAARAFEQAYATGFAASTPVSQ
jgi:tetratricopeptide (TPR) repeat protein